MRKNPEKSGFLFYGAATLIPRRGRKWGKKKAPALARACGVRCLPSVRTSGGGLLSAARLFSGLKFEPLAFKALGFSRGGGAAARTFFGTVAAAVTAAALALANGCVHAAAKIKGCSRNTQNYDNQLNIHASPSCSRWSFSAMWGMCA